MLRSRIPRLIRRTLVTTALIVALGWAGPAQQRQPAPVVVPPDADDDAPVLGGYIPVAERR